MVVVKLVALEGHGPVERMGRSTILQSLLGELAAASFLREFYHCLPFAMHSTAKPWSELGSWAVLGALLMDPEADVLVVAGGALIPNQRPKNSEEAANLCSTGHTILVRHAERRHGGFQRLAEAFEHDLLAPVDVHLYATPPGGFGFGWHYDAEDVFILQTSGGKEYSLRKNTVQPWPLVETIPSDMRYECERSMLSRVSLMAGDWLYIPCGYWHKAVALDAGEPSISLAIGVMSPAAIDLYDFLRARLVDSLVWRQRLPADRTAFGQNPEEHDEVLSALIRHLGDDLKSTLRDESFRRDFIQHCRALHTPLARA